MALGLIILQFGYPIAALSQSQVQSPGQSQLQIQQSSQATPSPIPQAIPSATPQPTLYHASEQKSLQGTWLILRGSFPDSIVELRRLVLPLDSTKMITCYRFSNQGELTLFTYAPPFQKLCANGLPYINKGEIIPKHHQRQLRVKIQGGYFMAGTFDYDIVYQLIQEPDHLVLIRNKFFRNKRCFTCPQQRQ